MVVQSRRAVMVMIGGALSGCGSATHLSGPLDPSKPTDVKIQFVAPTTYDGPVREHWTTGYTQGELDAAQQRFDLQFPPDLVALLLDRRPVDAPDWRTDEAAIRSSLNWPLEGLLFDVENNDLWWPEWGDKPTTADARQEVLRAVVARAPRLIPLVSHRYIPAAPHEAGNPVFSVHQSDVIYYGANLADYFEREFGDPRRPLVPGIKRIPFWSELVDRAGRSERPKPA